MTWDYIKHPFKILRAKYYAEYFKSKSFKILSKASPKEAFEKKWKADFGKNFNWENPQSLNEKISWLSFMTETTLWTKCTDKYEVREYVREKGLGHILTECYGVWDEPDKIEYDNFPNEFVLKCTHDQGSTKIIKDKSSINIIELNAFFSDRVSKVIGYDSCEPHYTRLIPRIMAEEMIPLSNNIKSISQIDYKFWCFNGNPYCCFICYDRDEYGHAKFNIYSVDTWESRIELLDRSSREKDITEIPRPKNLEEMVNIATVLSKDFPVVRVDLYNNNGKIYFGELTFTSCAGRMYYFSKDAQESMGKLITLPKL